MPAQKRKAPNAPETSGRRRSGRISSSGKKSQYFDGDTDEDGEDEFGAASETPPISTKKRGRGRPPKSAASTPGRGRPVGSKKARKVEPPEEEVDGDDYADEDEEQQEGSEEKGGGDGEYDDELGSDEEPRVTITPLAKMREIGGVPYEDERLHKNTMLFLKDLKANNKRSWLKGAWST